MLASRCQCLSAYLLNPWAWIQFAHNQSAALVTGSFAIAAWGAFYTLRGDYLNQASLYLRTGTLVGLVASLLVAFPTGDQQAKMVARHQPVTLAAMEGRFQGGNMADNGPCCPLGKRMAPSDFYFICTVTAFSMHSGIPVDASAFLLTVY
jgi:cytochrome bd-type quinol oxidase subunit 1